MVTKNDNGITSDQNDVLLAGLRIANEIGQSQETASQNQAKLKLMADQFTECGFVRDNFNNPYFMNINTDGTWNDSTRNPHLLPIDQIKIGKKEGKDFCTATVEQALNIRRAIFQVMSDAMGVINGTELTVLDAYDMSEAERKTLPMQVNTAFQYCNAQSHKRLSTLQNTVFPKTRATKLPKSAEQKIVDALEKIRGLLGELEVIKSEKFTIDELQKALSGFQKHAFGKTKEKK
tara:strand:+ start:165 stop:866 length:702 start_codon:yes stop_codon:yes gene_type:complete